MVSKISAPPKVGSRVSRKITRAATRIKLGLQENLYMGNLDARRDWGYARDCVEAMWMTLDAGEADDYVIATGRDRFVVRRCQ
jgi:GDPmannose 4,6-dehydratase